MHASATSVRHAPGFVGFDVFHVDPFGLGGFLREFDRHEPMVADIDILQVFIAHPQEESGKARHEGIGVFVKVGGRDARGAKFHVAWAFKAPGAVGIAGQNNHGRDRGEEVSQVVTFRQVPIPGIGVVVFDALRRQHA